MSRLIRTTTKRGKECTQVKKVCCLVKDDNVTILQRLTELKVYHK